MDIVLKTQLHSAHDFKPHMVDGERETLAFIWALSWGDTPAIALEQAVHERRPVKGMGLTTFRPQRRREALR
ncbi:hypothetical protein [Rhodobacter ferrooxidans]|uniref:hypothetical protein n=1 Tax=Rhodobacter ferrooxidans TaxID=371731 RepID=UPI0012E99629|nr:hypothetical protein [Rhodobacter sp. SW2]